MLLSVGPDFAILDTGAQSIAVPVARIARMQMLDLPLRIHLDNGGRRRDGPSKLGMAYLSGGIPWIPEYSVEIQDDSTAELTLRGTLIHEAEDLIHCDVNFVVGVPHFAHSDTLAPITVGQIVRTLGTAVAPPALRGQIMNRAVLVQNVRSPFIDPTGGVVAHDRIENEVDRALKAHQPSHNHYLDLVTLDGILKLHNYESREVEIRITARVLGKAIAASDDGELRIDPTRLGMRERQSTFRWRIVLQPGESKSLTYRYERYGPSN